MKKIISVLTFVLITQLLLAQLYTEKQSRHRFAQMSLGVDLQATLGGSTSFFDANQTIQSTNLQSTFSPRFLIGGTHFWGHADFYIAIPISSPTITKENQEIQSFTGVETVFKYYPKRIENNKLRAYIGTSIAPYYYEHHNNNFDYPNGPELNFTSLPLLMGVTYNSKQHLFELGLTWNYRNKRDYYISQNQLATINTPPIYTALSYKYMFDTTIGGERDWESGKTEEITNKLAALKRLNGFYFGIGMSSAFWIKESTYNTKNRPYVEKYNTSIMLDFALGYYFNKADINIAVAYRTYGSFTDSYAVTQDLKRKSFLLEATKFLFDYHGFVPFIGPNISYENLAFKESFEGIATIDSHENKVAYGLTFGWDIRPSKIQSWILRTNLRWYPNLFLEVEPNSKIAFDNIEFNFIQLIIYPNRLIKRK